jgi:GNAT superfamily N-acetyltransferase
MGFPGDALHPSAPQGSRHERPPIGGEAAGRRAYSWVPIRSLAPRHRERILAHLAQLDERDRYLRFGYLASDEQMRGYVEALDFERDEVFGVFNRRLELIALAHLAYQPAAADAAAPAMAEFGVSVLARARKRGLGARLFEHAMLHARNRGIDTLFIHALSENAAMLNLARSAGAVVHRDGPESQAVLKLPPETLASQVDQLVGDTAAEIDYRFKVQAQRVDRLLGVIAEVKSQLGETGKTGTQ